MADDLTNMLDEDFDAELDRRIDRVQAAWDALKSSLGTHLEGASSPLANVKPGAEALWREMEASETSLEEGWRELSRRKDRRLGL